MVDELRGRFGTGIEHRFGREFNAETGIAKHLRRSVIAVGVFELPGVGLGKALTIHIHQTVAHHAVHGRKRRCNQRNTAQRFLQRSHFTGPTAAQGGVDLFQHRAAWCMGSQHALQFCSRMLAGVTAAVGIHRVHQRA
ncbi:MAG: hypothetical protein RR326_17405, partial [Stenotrophomonas sp.]